MGVPEHGAYALLVHLGHLAAGGAALPGLGSGGSARRAGGALRPGTLRHALPAPAAPAVLCGPHGVVGVGLAAVLAGGRGVCGQAAGPGAGGEQLLGAGAGGAGVRLEGLQSTVHLALEQTHVLGREHGPPTWALGAALPRGRGLQVGGTGQDRTRLSLANNVPVFASTLSARVGGIGHGFSVPQGVSVYPAGWAGRTAFSRTGRGWRTAGRVAADLLLGEDAAEACELGAGVVGLHPAPAALYPRPVDETALALVAALPRHFVRYGVAARRGGAAPPPVLALNDPVDAAAGVAGVAGGDPRHHNLLTLTTPAPYIATVQITESEREVQAEDEYQPHLSPWHVITITVLAKLIVSAVVTGVVAPLPSTGGGGTGDLNTGTHHGRVA